MQVAQVKKAPFIDYSFLRKLENIYHNELEYSFMIIMSRHWLNIAVQFGAFVQRKIRKYN